MTTPRVTRLIGKPAKISQSVSRARSNVTRVWRRPSDFQPTLTRPTDTKQTRIVKKTVPTESFFNFFSPPEAPSDDEDAASDIEERLELDYQLGEDIKEKLIPRAIDWFTGEALQFEELDEDVEEGEFEDEDDEDDDDAEEQDDEEESDEEVRCRPICPPYLSY